MEEVQEALSSMRRIIRRIEDEQADVARKKADNEDVEILAKKQSEMESESRGRIQNIQSDISAIHQVLKRLADSVEAISDDLTKHKRKTANEIEAIAEPAPVEKKKVRGGGDDGKPFLPMQLQITLYVLAGVGIATLIQNAPAAVRTLPHLGFGG